MLDSLSWMSLLPLAAYDPSNPAQQAGYIVGMAVGFLLVLAVPVVAIILIILAFVKRTTGWIIAGAISGFVVLVFGVLFIVGFAGGVIKGYREAKVKAIGRSGPAEVVTGNVVHFTVEKPSSWSLKRGEGNFDAIMTDQSGFVGIIAEQADLGSTEPLAQFARKRFQTMGSDLTLGENQTTEIDGHQWIGFTAKCKVQNLPFAYQCYVYSGPEGSIQLMGWSFQSQWDRVHPTLDRVMRTIHLPAPEKAPAAAPAKL